MCAFSTRLQSFFVPDVSDCMDSFGCLSDLNGTETVKSRTWRERCIFSTQRLSCARGAKGPFQSALYMGFQSHFQVAFRILIALF